MTYTVKAGDSLSKIAARYGLTLAQLLQANPQIADPNRINVGDTVNLPDGSSATDETQPLPVNPVVASSTGNTQPLPSNPVTTSSGAIGSALADELGCLSAKYETGGRG